MMMNELNELFPRTREVLDAWGRDFVEKYKQGLIDKNANASKNLYNRVQYQLQVGTQAFELSLVLPDYSEYLEEGTRPHFPPREPIERWIRIKPVVPREDMQGKLPTQQQLAYLISRKISREGTKGRHIYQETYDATQEEWIARINEALDQDIEENVMAILETLL